MFRSIFLAAVNKHVSLDSFDGVISEDKLSLSLLLVQPYCPIEIAWTDKLSLVAMRTDNNKFVVELCHIGQSDSLYYVQKSEHIMSI
jgi:hypothetical protein